MLNTTEIKKAKQFWKQFLENYLSCEFLSEISQDQRIVELEGINAQVEKYCKGLLVSIGSRMGRNGEFRITIIANENSTYFQEIKGLVAYTPPLYNQYFSALPPLADKSVQLRLKINDSMVLDPARILVALGEVVGYPNYRPVTVYFDQYDKNKMGLMNELKMGLHS